MTVLTVALTHNESRLIRHFVHHYKRLGDVTIYDDGSTDDTVAVAKGAGANVLFAESYHPGDIERRLLWVKNHSWKSVRDQYDWIIAVDSDEFLYHDNLIEVLRHSQEMAVPVLMPCGYEMSSFDPPQDDIPVTTQIRRGAFNAVYSKPCCFNPRRVDEINIWGGGHHATPSGNNWFFFPYPGLKLLHYRYLGVAWVVARLANQQRAWRVDPRKLARDLHNLAARSVEVIPEGPIHWFEQAPVESPPFVEAEQDWTPQFTEPIPEPPAHTQGLYAGHVSRRPVGRWFLRDTRVSTEVRNRQ